MISKPAFLTGNLFCGWMKSYRWKKTASTPEKQFPPDLDLFQGHYPDHPILPGVILCEAAMQAAAVFIAKSGIETGDKVPVATRLNNTKFRRMVKPGETLDIHVTLTEKLSSAYFFTGKVSVGKETAARMEFAVTATDA